MRQPHEEPTGGIPVLGGKPHLDVLIERRGRLGAGANTFFTWRTRSFTPCVVGASATYQPSSGTLGWRKYAGGVR